MRRYNMSKQPDDTGEEEEANVCRYTMSNTSKVRWKVVNNAKQRAMLTSSDEGRVERGAAAAGA